MGKNIFWGVEKILPFSTPFFGIILCLLPTSKKQNSCKNITVFEKYCVKMKN